MRIALVSTCAAATPSSGSGEPELVAGELGKMLTRFGHQVTVYATGNSKPDAEVRALFKRPVFPANALAELRHARFAWDDIRASGMPFDIIHLHQTESLAFAEAGAPPAVFSIHHERNPQLLDFYREATNVTFVSASHHQASAIPELGVAHVVHAGLDPLLYELGLGQGGYATFIGKIHPAQAPHLAIDAARGAGVPLRIGGAMDDAAYDYFRDDLKPRLDAAGGSVDWLGAVSKGPKIQLLRHSRALLLPLGWDEPSGIGMMEAMLVGTPVIAFDRGCASEIIEDDVTGFLVRDCDEMMARLAGIASFDRRRCRERAIERWSSTRMAQEYESLYENVLRHGSHPRRASAVEARAQAPVEVLSPLDRPWALNE